MIQDRKKLVQGILGPAESKKEEGGEEIGSLHAICEDLISSLHAKDPQGVAEAFKAAFQHCESEPHEENGSEEG